MGGSLCWVIFVISSCGLFSVVGPREAWGLVSVVGPGGSI
jgi:hypothetical protein